MTSYENIIWVYNGGGLCSQLFGIITTCCIAKDINRPFYIHWAGKDFMGCLKICDNMLYNPSTARVKYRDIRKSDHEMMELFERKDVVMQIGSVPRFNSTQNLYQHFCYNRPHIDYKNNLMLAIGRLIPNIFSIEPRLINQVMDVRKVPGIHIRTNVDMSDDTDHKTKIPYIKDVLVRCKQHMDHKKTQARRVFIASDCSLTFTIAQRVFGNQYNILFNNGPIVDTKETTSWIYKPGTDRVMLDLMCLAKCESLYIGWHSNFSRMAALLSPNRNFFCYEHPSCSPMMYSPPIDELLSYYKEIIHRK